MLSSAKIYLFCLGAMLVASAAVPAAAEEWQRPTCMAAKIGRSVSREGGVYTGSTTRTGPDGGSYTSSSKCVAGVVDRCARSYSGTGPDGQSFSGKRVSARGPFRGRSAGSFTGPDGNTVFGSRRWRR